MSPSRVKPLSARAQVPVQVNKHKPKTLSKKVCTSTKYGHHDGGYAEDRPVYSVKPSTVSHYQSFPASFPSSSYGAPSGNPIKASPYGNSKGV